MRLQKMRRHTEEHVGDGGEQEDGQRQRGSAQGVPQGAHFGPPAEEQHRHRQQVGPHIQGFIVPLEEAEEVAAPVLLDGAVA